MVSLALLLSSWNTILSLVLKNVLQMVLFRRVANPPRSAYLRELFYVHFS